MYFMSTVTKDLHDNQSKAGKKRVAQDWQQQNLRWVDAISQILLFLNFVNTHSFCKTRKGRMHNTCKSKEQPFLLSHTGLSFCELHWTLA